MYRQWFTPHLAVYVDRSVQVPQEYVKNNEIVLNVSFEATSQLQLGNEFVEFKARFGGIAREIRCRSITSLPSTLGKTVGGMAFLCLRFCRQPMRKRGDPVVEAIPLRRKGRWTSLGPWAAKDAVSPLKMRLLQKWMRQLLAHRLLRKRPMGMTKGPPEVPPPNNGRPTLRRIKRKDIVVLEYPSCVPA